ncbi:Predicted arabinose efflux permease, MFS family [Tessaracoccus bendigoensis DSM 12906]|uniref:Predicted arabinose efflux permease, MFS family n=1 Tax=Tessaracoccus bendigoensis DSM 12906 TaxID=1123357 RepID=A0A1M6LYD8_9ACTN|nr:MFS transporter [Tessaracoccus bendigoensis]SHJ76063.1 Predicted arabinose efflux permease, MFS family [Tessaracoccus bendigoensis DSM 12906]
MIGLRNPGLGRNFNRFWTGESLSHFAVQLGAVALPVISVDLLHASESQLGYLNAASTAAFLVLGLPAGAWVDRWFKRPTMIWANLVRGLAISIVPVLYLAGVLELWHLYVIAGVVGIATVFFDVSYQSFIPMLVGPGQISRANSRMEATAQLARLAGPALGGLLLKVVSAPLLLIADGLGYLASWGFLLVTRDHEAEYRASRPPRERRNLVVEIREGLGFVLRQPAISRITLASLLSNFASTATYTLVPIVVLRLLGFSPFEYGVIMTLGAVGGLLGAAAAGRVTRRVGTANAVRFSTLAGALAVFCYPFAMLLGDKATQFVVLVVGAFIGNSAILVYNVTQVSLRQRLCPPHLLGRMNASVRFIVWGIMPVSSIVAGWASQSMGVGSFLWITAGLGTLAFVPLWRLHRHIPA